MGNPANSITFASVEPGLVVIGAIIYKRMNGMEAGLFILVGLYGQVNSTPPRRKSQAVVTDGLQRCYTVAYYQNWETQPRKYSKAYKCSSNTYIACPT